MDQRQDITDLTICRGLFAGWVFAYHIDLYAQFSRYLGPAAGIIRHGYLGVDGFFILSGLILTRVHPELFVTPVTAARFWGRRLIRIYPVHLAVIVILAVLVLTGHALGLPQRDPARFSETGLIENLLLVHGWGFSHHLGWNYPSWSVSTEWAGYLLFPALALFFGQCNTVVSGQILVICVPVLGLLAYVTHGLNLTFGAAMIRFFIEFIAGIATARLVPVWADGVPTRGMALTGFWTVAIFAIIGSDLMTVVGLLLVIGGLAMQADAERPPLLGTSAGLQFLGRLSYSFYMSFGTTELLVVQLFRHLGWDPAGDKFMFAAAMVVLTFLMAVALHVVVETPCRRFGDRFLSPALPLA